MTDTNIIECDGMTDGLECDQRSIKKYAYGWIEMYVTQPPAGDEGIEWTIHLCPACVAKCPFELKGGS